MSLSRLHDPLPAAHLLSNGRYTVLLTHAGTGYSACDQIALTRWDADRTQDADGFFIYVKDLDRGELWSAGSQPVCRPAERYTVGYQPGHLSIERFDLGIETCL